MIRRGGKNLHISIKRDPGELKDYIVRDEKFAVWCKNDHVSLPINFFDIQRYKIYLLDDPNERIYVPVESSYTFFPEDLYFNQIMR